MKHKIRLGFVGLVCFCVVLLTGCGGTSGGSISTVGNPDFEIPSGQTAFYSPATDTTPVIEATGVSASVNFVTAGWTSGNPVYEIFNALQEYTYPDDEGVIDVSNIYKLLFEAGNAYDTALGEVEELEEPTIIESPFDFGNTPIEYTFASDEYALAMDDDTVYALLTWTWDESPKMSYGVIEGNFDQVTGALELDMVYLVDYEGDSDYCLRTHIEGNATTHTFTLKAAKYNTGEGAYAVSMIGKGVSQSENEDDYFVMKMIDSDNLSAYEDGRYYRFSALADEAELREHDSDGYAAGEFEDENNYADDIDALSFFALDGSDHATALSDFTDSSLTLIY